MCGNEIKRKLLQFWVLEADHKKVKDVIEEQQRLSRSIKGQHHFTIGDTLEYIIAEWAKTHNIKINEE